MNIYFVRHTSVNVPKGTCYGVSDVPLNESTFPAEAAAVKEKLSGITFDASFTSPLSRCTRLAQYCGHPEAVRDKRILEMNFGDWEMQKYDEITDPHLQAWFADYRHLPATGGEAWTDQLARVSEFIDYVRTLDADNVVVFAHGGVLVCARIYAKIATLDDGFYDIPYGSVLKLEF